MRYLGSVGSRGARRRAGRRGCLLHPIAFAEPFGLSVVEAMVCGTPVVAYPRGAMPEVVDDGLTGVLVEPDDLTQPSPASDAPCASTVPPAGAGAVERFSADRMVDDYLRVYEGVLHGR